MLRRAMHEYAEHYHLERNHQGLGNQLIVPLQTLDQLFNDAPHSLNDDPISDVATGVVIGRYTLIFLVAGTSTTSCRRRG